jgi:hypothetical protein
MTDHCKRSKRQELLPQEIRDLFKYIFESNAINVMGVPTCVIEVKLDNPLHYVLNGDGGFHQHGLSDSLRYLHHYEDEDWAVVFYDDCDGGYDNGEKYLMELLQQHTSQNCSVPD